MLPIRISSNVLFIYFFILKYYKFNKLVRIFIHIHTKKSANILTQYPFNHNDNDKSYSKNRLSSLKVCYDSWSSC